MTDQTLPSTRRPRKSTGYSPVRKRMEKENITVDVASSLAGNGGRKKSRSKSIGPGGLDVLKSGSGNRRVSLAAPVRPPPRSILKPTIPLIPEIPPHKPKSRGGNNALHNQGVDLLGSFNGEPSSSGTKVALRTEEEQQAAAREREEKERKALEKEIKDRREARRKSLANRRVSFAAEATLHTFHEVDFNQDYTGSTDATRRASQFAAPPLPPDEMSDPPSTPPEQVEDAPDTPEHQRELHQKKHRRSSALPSTDYDDDNTVASTVYSSDSDATDGVEEVEEEVESDDGSDSDADGTTMDLVVDEVTGTSIASELSARSVSPDDGNDTLDDALRQAARQARTQALDEEEEIIPSFGWARKPAPKKDIPEKSTPSASRQSPQANEPEDQDGDDGMDMDMDVTQAMGGIFKPNQEAEGLEPEEEMSMDVTKVMGGILPQRAVGARRSMSPEKTHEDSQMDDSTMDLTMSIGQIRQAPQDDGTDMESNADNEDMSMELTSIMGGVMSSKQTAANKRKSLPSRRRTLKRADDDSTMDMTVGLGRIIPADQNNEDEDGGDVEAMDLTMAMGGIIKGPSPVKDRTAAKRAMEEEANQADSSPLLPGSPPKRQVSTVVGASAASETGSPGPQALRAKGLRRSVGRASPMRLNSPQLNSSPFKRLSPAKEPGPAKEPTAAREPSPAKESSPIREPSPAKEPSPVKEPSPARAPTPAKDSTPAEAPSSAKEPSPAREPSPAKEATPVNEPTPAATEAPSSFWKQPTNRTPSRTPSPQRLVVPNLASTPKSTRKSPFKSSHLFQQDPSTGVSTPRVVLTPQNRKLSGLGADRNGLGSPRVSAILDRRESIGDSASEFVPGKAARGVSFAAPQELEEAIDRERQSEEDRENGRSILEREANGSDDENNTASLKDMIASMSPQKKKDNPFRGRKSLHAGSARGLLGKRPIELDEEDEERDGVKRLKGHQSSPVKNVRLHAPPSKAETTGRMTRSARKSMEESVLNSTTPTTVFSPKTAIQSAPSPQAQGRFKDVPNDQPTETFNLEEPRQPLADPEALDEDNGERMHLQDFLNMTSIRFMELTTTKRRHTQAPTALKDSILHLGDDDVSLERCVVAGACTVPMLELYQHVSRKSPEALPRVTNAVQSCRELKKYISEGRRIVREIETETLEENPPLFKEYITATPEFKLLMDNQFKNVKTHARLLSKAMWYEWRMKLQDGLKEGLIKIAEDMVDDEQFLQKQEALLQAVLPDLANQFETLQREHESLQSVAREIADCDPEELQAARTELSDLDSENTEKMRQIEELRQVLQETEATVNDMTERKQECISAIEEAEKVREECRGWSSAEIRALKANVDAIEKEHGWAIKGLSGTTVCMSYRRQIELSFDIASFKGMKTSAAIDLSYMTASQEVDSQPPAPEKAFFCACIRDYIRSLVPSEIKIPTLLQRVSSAWNRAIAASNNIRLLNCTFPTEVVAASETTMTLKVALLLVPLETKVHIAVDIQARSTAKGMDFAIVPQARVVYGEQFKMDKVNEYLSTRLGDRVTTQEENKAVESWSDIIVELHERLIARGRR